MRSLRSFARRLVLAFDADAAGQAAADRVYEWERRFDLDVAVAAMPKGSDPADLARTDPDALRPPSRRPCRFSASASTACSTLGARRHPRAARVPPRPRSPSSASIRTSLVRDQYVMQVAARCQHDPDRLRGGAGPRAAHRHACRSPTEHSDEANARDGRGSRAASCSIHRGTRPRPYLHEVAVHATSSPSMHFRALRHRRVVQDAIEVGRAAEAADLLRRLDQEADQAATLDPADRDRASDHERRRNAELAARARGAETDRPTSRDVRSGSIDDVPRTRCGSEAAAQLLGWLEGQDEER